MSQPALAPRNAFHGVIAVWAVALLAAIAVGVFLAGGDWMGGMVMVFGGVVLLSFAVQLAYGRAPGFIVRVAGSVVGSLVLMGVVSVVVALTALITVL